MQFLNMIELAWLFTIKNKQIILFISAIEKANRIIFIINL